MSEVRTLRQARAKLVEQARRDWNAAEQRGGLAGEDRHVFDRRMADADDLAAKIEEAERRSGVTRPPAQQPVESRSLARAVGRQTEPDEPGRVPGVGKRGSVEYRASYERYLIGGDSLLSQGEKRALASESNPAGGYLVAPQQMANELIKAVDNAVWIRQLATKFTTASQSIGAPALDNDPDDCDWTAELGTGDEDSTMTFGKRELHPHALAKRIKVSNKLLRLVPSAEAIVRERLAYKFAVSCENAYLTGDGAGKPLGVFVASSAGIPTSRDVSADNTTTTISADNLINCKYALKEAYQKSPTTAWIFHRDAIKQLVKLKNGDGQYLWQSGLQFGQPDLLLDAPLRMSEYAPNTFTTGQYVGIVGDWSKYWIADAADLAIQRLVELYAEGNQTGFIGRLETDGMPVLAEAFVRVKLA